ncbi:CMRF35-like molecule 8 [Trachinotus anak]|uniref:CMRF35-like molecule 8 n=1 Tax=Trachinotus anak TaxID=443729 RepID=UPI0039F1F27F
MKVHHIVICCFFLSLQDVNIGFINAEISIYKGTDGGNITVECLFSSTAHRKYVCRDKCRKKDILIETNRDRDQSGRYSIMFKGRRSGGGTLYVTITQLTQSDSGRYGCGLDKPFSGDPYREFNIIVTNAPSTSNPPSAHRPSLTSAPSASTPTTTQSLRRRSTRSASSTEQQQTETTAGGSGVLLYLSLAAVVMVILFSLGVLTLCRKRATKPKEPPGETVYDNVIEDNRVYEEIREVDRQSRAPPVEISTIYTYAKFHQTEHSGNTDD